MTKNKKLISLAFVSAAAIGVGVSFVDTNTGAFKLLSGETNEVWNHYKGISSTLYERGSKEYWVSCSTSEHQFTAPVGATIQEKTEAANFANALGSDDDRLVKNKTVYDFEDGDMSIIDKTTSVNITKYEIVDDGVGGSKALKTTNSAYVARGINFSKAWVDLAFANSATEAILFDVKSVGKTKWFEYKINGTRYKYGVDDDWTGVNTNFKTFAFTRAMYESANTIEYIIGTDQAISHANYIIDNIRVGKTIDESKNFAFDSGELSSDSNYLFTYRNNAAASWKSVSFLAAGAGVNKTTSGYDYTIKSTGLRSFRADITAAWSQFCINGQLVNNIPEGGSLVFDVYAPTKVSNVKYAGKSSYEALDAGWKTITIAKADLTTNVSYDSKAFMEISGTTTQSIYFDNFRIAGSQRNIAYDFEEGSVSGKYAIPVTQSAAYSFNNANFGLYLETSQDYTMALATNQAYTGNKSIKITLTANYKGWFGIQLNKDFVSELPDEGVEFNVLALNGGKFHDLKDINGVKVGEAGGKWQTVKIAKANIASGKYILSGNNSLAGDYYFDNIHAAK